MHFHSHMFFFLALRRANICPISDGGGGEDGANIPRGRSRSFSGGMGLPLLLLDKAPKPSLYEIVLHIFNTVASLKCWNMQEIQQEMR